MNLVDKLNLHRQAIESFLETPRCTELPIRGFRTVAELAAFMWNHGYDPCEDVDVGLFMERHGIVSNHLLGRATEALIQVLSGQKCNLALEESGLDSPHATSWADRIQGGDSPSERSNPDEGSEDDAPSGAQGRRAVLLHRLRVLCDQTGLGPHARTAPMRWEMLDAIRAEKEGLDHVPFALTSAYILAARQRRIPEMIAGTWEIPGERIVIGTLAPEDVAELVALRLVLGMEHEASILDELMLSRTGGYELPFVANAYRLQNSQHSLDAEKRLNGEGNEYDGRDEDRGPPTMDRDLGPIQVMDPAWWGGKWFGPHLVRIREGVVTERVPVTWEQMIPRYIGSWTRLFRACPGEDVKLSLFDGERVTYSSLPREAPYPRAVTTASLNSGLWRDWILGKVIAEDFRLLPEPMLTSNRKWTLKACIPAPWGLIRPETRPKSRTVAVTYPGNEDGLTLDFPGWALEVTLYGTGIWGYIQPEQRAKAIRERDVKERAQWVVQARGCPWREAVRLGSMPDCIEKVQRQCRMDGWRVPSPPKGIDLAGWIATHLHVSRAKAVDLAIEPGIVEQVRLAVFRATGKLPAKPARRLTRTSPRTTAKAQGSIA